MRLLQARTRKLQEFHLRNAPPYAILSHTWGEDEVTFMDITSNPNVEKMKGYQKIRFLCAQALKDGLQYAWCDTCCIDKSSSAELSEAINSMWTYYRKAESCYAYIEDISIDSCGATLENRHLVEKFLKCRWFERAWTLQELIAPRFLSFYDVGWNEVGRRLGRLVQIISAVTGIPESVLNGGNVETKVKRCSIASRMSWAAQRTATREEDEAYCLLGIFDINMPMLYGEGNKAFRRLQEEIIKTSTDHSILAHEGWSGRHSPFAYCPLQFRNCKHIDAHDDHEPMESYSMTNRGLLITLPIVKDPFLQDEERRFIMVALNCRYKGRALSLLLRQLTRPRAGSQIPQEYCMWEHDGETVADRPVQMIVGVDESANREYRTIVIRSAIPIAFLFPDARAELSRTPGESTP